MKKLTTLLGLFLITWNLQGQTCYTVNKVENKTENIEAVEDTSKIEPSNDTQEKQITPDEAQKQFFINLLKN